MIASTDMLPMVAPEDYQGTIISERHFEIIGDDRVFRVQILHADQHVSMLPEFMRHLELERLPYAPCVVVIRDEIDGRELYYRQVGWYYTPDRHIVGAFERLTVLDDLVDEPIGDVIAAFKAGENAAERAAEVKRPGRPDEQNG
jgi:hypothetical protein